MRTHTYQFWRLRYGVRFDTFELFLGCPHIARDGAVNPLGKEVTSKFIIIPRCAVRMTNLPRRFSHPLAELLDLLLLPLIILFPFNALRCFSLRIGVIVSLVFFETMVVFIDLKDLVDGPVQKLPIVRYHQYSATILREIRLQPFHAREVEMIGGFIEQQQVRRLKQQRSKPNTCLLPTGERLYFLRTRQ